MPTREAEHILSELAFDRRSSLGVIKSSNEDMFLWGTVAQRTLMSCPPDMC